MDKQISPLYKVVIEEGSGTIHQYDAREDDMAFINSDVIKFLLSIIAFYTYLPSLNEHLRLFWHVREIENEKRVLSADDVFDLHEILGKERHQFFKYLMVVFREIDAEIFRQSAHYINSHWDDWILSLSVQGNY